ncbi:MAG TPA: sulfatase [Candidatus Hydrogenedentes bacterium]|nr:sulfatase [Candidatus Hydrogenedentota bacterium]HQH52916.1 sulfatase [Candidatus Hydrogenedentota bacterium]HQM49010.1 sulfatase [Candidatus Hydrogenedentota bacterium]
MAWVMMLAAVMASPDVFFVTVDTLRADHLGMYGYERPTSPNLDALAAKSLRFDNCVCEVPLTSPSFGSMLASRYPRSTATTRNGLPMPAWAPLATERFYAAGYQTICIQSNWTLKADLCGLDRGFERYDADFRTRRWGVLKSERYADEVSRRAVEAIKTRDPGRPLFCWIHYSDPHAPYRYHEGFDPWGIPLRKLGDIEQTRARYDSELAYADHHIQEVLSILPKENAFIVFVADHGESLHEHNYLGHGRRVYQPGVRIPLFIHGPGIQPGVTHRPARALDIGPTLLGLAGLEPFPGMEGVDLLNGNVPDGRVRVFETYGGAVPNLPGAKAIMGDLPSMRQAVIDGAWKLIIDGPRDELFHLEDDPGELQNLSGARPGDVARLRKFIEEWDAKTPRIAPKKAELSAEDIEALEDLGYVE